MSIGYSECLNQLCHVFCFKGINKLCYLINNTGNIRNKGSPVITFSIVSILVVVSGLIVKYLFSGLLLLINFLSENIATTRKKPGERQFSGGYFILHFVSVVRPGLEPGLF